jgi:hypothetical protein
MPALNIEFDPEEMARLRELAAQQGRPLKAVVKDAALQQADDLRALNAGAEVFRAYIKEHAEEFAAAFPEPEQPHRQAGAA